MRENFDFLLYDPETEDFDKRSRKNVCFSWTDLVMKILVQKSEVYVNRRDQGQYSLVSG